MKKILSILFLLILIAGSIIAYTGYSKIFAPNVHDIKGNHILYIPTGSTINQVADSLEYNDIIIHRDHFIWCSEKMKYGKESRIKPGKYKINSGLSNRDLISKLRLGTQSPVSITIPASRELSVIAGLASKKLELDSSSLMQLINNGQKIINTASPIYFNKVIPNTYQFNWNTTEEEFLSRIDQEYEKFWSSNNRNQKASALNLDRNQVYTLASIVERETNYVPEKKTIAGVYLNRIKRGIALQADPTVVFALGDFTIRRVLKKYLSIDSPYNTYKYPGLPPGPIGLASMSSIDAVLNHETHDYIFFCARPDHSGQHNFAETLAGHNQNARKFQRWLNERGIRK